MTKTSLLGLAIVLAVGLTVGNLLTDKVSNLLYKIDAPRMIDTIEDLPGYNENQDYSQKEFSPLVRLEAMDGEFFCSGSVISDEYVLTAAHCIEEGGRLRKTSIKVVSLVNHKKEILQVEAVAAAKNSRADYGVIRGDFKRFTKVKISFRPQSILEIQGPVLACGFPWGAEDFCYQAGDFNMYYNFIGARGVLFPGMSGGPVIDRGTGLVFAVNSAMVPGGVLFSPLIGLFDTLKIPLNKE